jgi:hypothetical protein
MPIISAIWEAEVEGLKSKTGPDKGMGPYLKNKLKQNGLVEHRRPRVQTPVPPKKKKKIESKKERCYWLTEGRVQECYYNILQCIEQPATAKNYAALNVNDAKVEELCSK